MLRYKVALVLFLITRSRRAGRFVRALFSADLDRAARIRVRLARIFISIRLANTSRDDKQNAQHSQEIDDVSLHRSEGPVNGCLITQDVAVFCQLICSKKVDILENIDPWKINLLWFLL